MSTKRPRMTEEEKAKILRMHSEGMTGAEIADKTGRSRPAVYKLLSESTSEAPKEEDQESGTPEQSAEYWRAKYRAAIKLLIDHDLIEIEI